MIFATVDYQSYNIRSIEKLRWRRAIRELLRLTKTRLPRFSMFDSRHSMFDSRRSYQPLVHDERHTCISSS